MPRSHHGFSVGHLLPIALMTVFALADCNSNRLPIGEKPDGGNTDASSGTGGAGTGGVAGAGSGGIAGSGTGGTKDAGSGGTGTGGAVMTDASTLPETAPSIDANMYDGRPLAGCEACLKYKQCCQAIYPDASNCGSTTDSCVAEPTTGASRSAISFNCNKLMVDELVTPRKMVGAPIPGPCM